MAFQLNAPIRIAGQGGAGLFVEPLILPPSEPEGSLQSGIDITLLSPDRMVTYLARRVLPGFSRRLADFLSDAAVADGGPDTPTPFQDPIGGILIEVIPVDEMWVEIDVRLVADLEADVADYDGVNFESTRASLLIGAQAAQESAASLAEMGAQ
jgi:hypothetical protein